MLFGIVLLRISPSIFVNEIGMEFSFLLCSLNFGIKIMLES